MERDTWSKEVEFILAAVGYSVGLGNVWRFPYLCFQSGGGAFLIPFFLMLILCGVPLLFMELAVGQYTKQGPVGALKKICPLFQALLVEDQKSLCHGASSVCLPLAILVIATPPNGAGLATVVISFLFTTYYNVIIAWSFYYLFSSFSSELPWSHCNHDWNSQNCWDGSNRMVVLKNITISNVTVLKNVSETFRPNNTVSPTEDFFDTMMLQKTSGIDDMGTVKWDLALILLMCWILVYFCIWKGPRGTGKIVYFTATFPYLVLISLLVRGVTLKGSMKGIEYFVYPKWELLMDPKVWVNAAAQNFNSLGIAFGGIITMSSYNKFNNKIVKDVLTIAVVDAITCILAGFAIFAILGYLAENQGKEVEDVISQGPGLVFKIYPEAFTTMPLPQLFSVAFFFMLICLGIDSQFASVEVIVTTINDHFAPQVKKYLKRKEVLVAVVCAVSFLCGLPNIAQGGIYFFSLIDHYAAAVSLMYLAFFEVIAITWIYGAKRLACNVQEMTGSKPNVFFIVCWYFASPLFIFGIWMFSMVSYRPFKLDSYEFPMWATALGWVIAMLSVVCVPVGMVHAVVTAKGDTLWKRIKNTLTSSLPNPGECDSYYITDDIVHQPQNGFIPEKVPLQNQTNEDMHA